MKILESAKVAVVWECPECTRGNWLNADIVPSHLLNMVKR
jgi:hypothetical protein